MRSLGSGTLLGNPFLVMPLKGWKLVCGAVAIARTFPSMLRFVVLAAAVSAASVHAQTTTTTTLPPGEGLLRALYVDVQGLGASNPPRSGSVTCDDNRSRAQNSLTTPW